MATNFNECFNNPFKGVYLIVPDDQAAGLFVTGEQIGIFPAFREYIVLGSCHDPMSKAKI
jgi:hypothetical protein